MSYLVIVVAFEAEPILHPFTKGYFSIRIMCTDKQKRHVNGDNDINRSGEFELLIGEEEDR